MSLRRVLSIVMGNTRNTVFFTFHFKKARPVSPWIAPLHHMETALNQPAIEFSG